MTGFTADYIPRPPTKDEQKELSAWLLSESYNPEDADQIARTAYVAVFDDFATGGPGYIGKVMSVVWDNLNYHAFLWRDGKIQELIQEN